MFGSDWIQVEGGYIGVHGGPHASGSVPSAKGARGRDHGSTSVGPTQWTPMDPTSPLNPAYVGSNVFVCGNTSQTMEIASISVVLIAA